MSFSSCWHWQVSIQVFGCKWQFKLLWCQVDQTKIEFRNGLIAPLATLWKIQHFMKDTNLWNFIVIPTIHYTSIAIPSAEVAVSSVSIADGFSISSDENAKPVIIISVLAQFSQHRAQTLPLEVWLISATVFNALLKTVAFIFFLTCSELCWNLVGPQYVNGNKTFLIWNLIN